MADFQSWTRRFDLRETPQAFHAFQHFLSLPLRARSLDRAYTVCRVTCPRDRGRLVAVRKNVLNPPDSLPHPLLAATGTWRAWRKKMLWDGRASDHDSFLETETREERVEAIREMNARHSAIARAVTGKIIERLQTIVAADLSPGQLITWLEKACAVERLARGVPTAIQQQQVENSVPPDLSGLSEAELETLETLLEKAHAAPTPGA
jgi:hypothetical protein